MRRVLAGAWLLVLACGGESAPTQVEQRPVGWVEGAYTQPVPSWGSPVRLALPVALGDILFGPGYGLGAYGAHQGGHVEGLNHVWIPTRLGIPVRSWAAGTVTRIEDLGSRGTPDGRHEYFITIDYGHGLIGKHLDVDVPLVSVGAKVAEGAPVGSMTGSAEFMLIDENRSDGESTGASRGVYVSPFDYLRADVQSALVARHVAEVVGPYFQQGAAAGNSRPWEPLLTNPLIFHSAHKGTLQGEWILTNRTWNAPGPVYYNVMTWFDVTNAYGHFQRVEFGDPDWSAPGSKRSSAGTWTSPDGPGTAIITLQGSAPWYARYAIDESRGRAKLTIEMKQGGYPATLSANAAVYTERAPLYLAGDVAKLGLTR
jgi:hypothetical protein